jgi:replicative DNA helicase|tara:strand:+ start:9202 stop:10578 length:1377 start_codon:yes stop_codon:yes gene_type:complete
MAVDLQKLAIKRLLQNQSPDFFNKLVNKYFTGNNLLLFRKVNNFYTKNLRIPSVEEFLQMQKQESQQDYFKREFVDVFLEGETTVNDEFISSQLQDFYIREETISFLDGFIDELDNLEQTEIIDKIQEHILSVQKFIPEGEELFDVATIETVPTEENFIMYPSGLSSEFDAENGGFGLQELVLFGGRRGSGKSIITLNMALNNFLLNNSVAFMSIEMRYVEVYYRLMSMLSGVPFSNFMLNKLTHEDKVKVASSKLDAFYKDTDEAKKLLKNVTDTQNFNEFDMQLRKGSVPFKDSRFHIIDDVQLSLARIDHYLNMMTSKHDIKMCVVDYLNIVKVEDRMDWKSQISISDSLKTLARKYKVIMISPYQIDNTGEARFAKGVLDSADKSFRFMPSDLNEDPTALPFEVAKIRNGKAMKFNVHMDWDCLRIDSNKSKAISGRILNRYGNDTKEQGRDLG